MEIILFIIIILVVLLMIISGSAANIMMTLKYGADWNKENFQTEDNKSSIFIVIAFVVVLLLSPFVYVFKFLIRRKYLLALIIFLSVGYTGFIINKYFNKVTIQIATIHHAADGFIIDGKYYENLSIDWGVDDHNITISINGLDYSVGEIAYIEELEVSKGDHTIGVIVNGRRSILKNISVEKDLSNPIVFNLGQYRKVWGRTVLKNFTDNTRLVCVRADEQYTYIVHEDKNNEELRSYRYDSKILTLSTRDNGLLVVGKSFASKIDSNGSIDWRKYYSSPTARCCSEYGVVKSLLTDISGVIETNDNGYMLIGKIKHSKNGIVQYSKIKKDILVRKIDYSGNKIWENIYTDQGTFKSVGIERTKDSNKYRISAILETYDENYKKIDKTIIFTINHNGRVEN